jgi:antitoxin component YwqK of YwqJK toxin-antitoxin module
MESLVMLCCRVVRTDVPLVLIHESQINYALRRVLKKNEQIELFNDYEKFIDNVLVKKIYFQNDNKFIMYYKNGRPKVCHTHEYIDNKYIYTLYNIRATWQKFMRIKCITVGDDSKCVSMYWHRNGQLHSRKEYLNDKLHGPAIYYYENGNLCEYIEHCMGEIFGLHIYCHRNGRIYTQHYRDGKNLESRFYSPSGDKENSI